MSREAVDFTSGERIGPEEYLDFLGRSELGSMYPKQRFRERLARLLENADVVIAARLQGKLVGVCMGVTDFSYFLFITDLGVDRLHKGQGIGRELLTRAHEAAGGRKDICMITWSDSGSLPFYKSVAGMDPKKGLIAVHAEDWTLFDVRDENTSESAPDELSS